MCFKHPIHHVLLFVNNTALKIKLALISIPSEVHTISWQRSPFWYNTLGSVTQLTRGIGSFQSKMMHAQSYEWLVQFNSYCVQGGNPDASHSRPQAELQKISSCQAWGLHQGARVWTSLHLCLHTQQITWISSMLVSCNELVKGSESTQGLLVMFK